MMSVEITEVETFFGRCRCCLAYGYLKNMWSEHKYNGNPEIYGEMLAKCFALTWDHSEDSAEEDQICEDCIVRLRDAHDFKKVVLESQKEFTKMLEDENEAAIKEERLDESLLAEQSDEDDEMSQMETEYITFNADTMESIKEEAPETEYTNIEYLEDEDANITIAGDNSMAGDHVNDSGDSVSDSSQAYNTQPVQQKKRLRDSEPDDESETPKRKWPQKLPKSERHKTYKQYSELDLQKCLEEVRNGALTPGDAADLYNIPKKTICAKVKTNAPDVPIDNTTKSKPKMDQRQKRVRNKPTIFKSNALDENTIKQIENNKLKVKNLTKKVKKEDLINVKTTKNAAKKDVIDKEKNVKEVDAKIEITLEPKPEQIDANQVRKHYKAIINNKFKNQEPEKQQDTNEMNKHKDNLKHILDNSNATCLKGNWKSGYYCNFCNERTELPSEMKKHNLEAHNSIDDVITVKYVSDLFIRIDITDLKCKICNGNFKKLDDFTEHLVKIHDIKFHTDIKNYIIPFVFDKDTMKCALCNKDFKYFKLLSDHMSDHYRNFECPICDRAFVNRQCMQTHLYRHKKGVFKCSQCPKVFDSRPKKSTHERVVHALLNKTRKCTLCDERFATKDLVQAHASKVHGLEQPVFPCQACNKSYNSESSLLTHRKRFHLMLRPHKCSYCEMAFYSKIELKSHTVTHTKTREFNCDRCSKSFGTRCSLNQHIKGHLNDRRFKCDLCVRSFVHRTAYRGHMRTIHSTIV